MSWQIIITGFLLGAVSSFHCVGMCGPIALSLPVHYLPARQKTVGIILYNLGRISLYALLGVFFGFAGRQFYLGGLQQGFSIFLGSLLIALFLMTIWKVNKQPLGFVDKGTKFIQRRIAFYLQQKKLSAMFVLGVSNGLLPCGMVYFALTGALAAGTVQGGAIFMTAFGLGTFPAMFVISLFGSLFRLSARNFMKKAYVFGILIMGILLIFRGLNLNIPYLSPYLTSVGSQAVSCHN